MNEQLHHSIQEIKARLPLGDLLPSFGFPPPRNSYRYRSPCRLHGGDNRSAFSADLRKNIWFCHSRQHGGDQLSFIQEARQCSFPQAVEWAAARVGIVLPTSGLKPSPISAAMLRLRRQLRDTALAELANEEADYREIEEMFYSALRSCMQRLYANPKSDWMGRDYTRELLIDECGDELDEVVRERQTRFESERRRLYAEYA